MIDGIQIHIVWSSALINGCVDYSMSDPTSMPIMNVVIKLSPLGGKLWHDLFEKKNLLVNFLNFVSIDFC
jgi:hypothetical protein